MRREENTRVNSREIGLLIALLFNKYLFNSEHLHYGLWTDDLEVNFFNVPRAQEKYCDFLAAKIPPGCKTILDVGCGSGSFARRLADQGYRVDCVSPSRLLTERVKKVMTNGCRIFECAYEDLETENTYDLVLFSESFQYIKLDRALAKTASLLNDGGHLLICDFFKTDAQGKSLHGGGHKLAKFFDRIANYPFRQLQDIDITDATARNMTLFNDFSMKVGVEARDLVSYYMDSNRPVLHKIIKRVFRKRLAKINDKYFSGQRTAENFKTFKTYRCFLYKKTDSTVED